MNSDEARAAREQADSTFPDLKIVKRKSDGRGRTWTDVECQCLDVDA